MSKESSGSFLLSCSDRIKHLKNDYNKPYMVFVVFSVESKVIIWSMCPSVNFKVDDIIVEFHIYIIIKLCT